MPHLVARRKVRFTQEEVDDFRRQWPCCNLQSRSYWFEFEANGDLVGTDVPEQDDGEAARALSEEASTWFADNPDAPITDPVLAAATARRVAAETGRNN